MVARVVNTARRRPGRCVLSAETQGPFIDTGKDVPRYGRIYISFKWLDSLLRERGYLKEEDISGLQQENDRLKSENSLLSDMARRFDKLVEAVAEYLPQPDPEVIEKEVVKARNPTDEEIEDWIQRNGAKHPAVQKAKAPEPGSTAEWFSLYGNPRKKTTTKVEEPKTEELTKEAEVTPDEGPAKVVELYGQQVDLDKVLAENVPTIEAFCEDKPDEFLEALVRREYHLAETTGREVRKGVLNPLGYWDSEEGPLYPSDEEE